MDIESEFSKRKILKTNQGVYDLSLCRWKALSSLPNKKKEITNPPCQGYIHAASKLNDSLYVIIGPDEKHPEQGMYSYSFKRNEWKYWPDCNLPANRDSFGFVTHQTQLYMFGGSSFDSQLGDTHVFSNFTSSWRVLDGYGPSPRNPMIFTDVKGQYIFLYGGVDIEAQKIFEDAYLLIDGTWKQLQVRNGPRCLVGASSAVCGEEVFIFGGQLQGYGGAAPQFNTTLYKLAIDVDGLGVEFIQVPLSNEIKPSPRTSHSMIGIETGNIILIGGIGLQGTNKNQILRDMWLFNVDLLAWTRVDPANGALRGFCESWVCLHQNKIFILGGLVERLDTWNEQISVIEFAEDQTIRNQICSNCQQRNQIRDRQEKAFPKAVLLSTGFFYNISSQYRHPFQAILGLHQCSAALGANTFRFSITKGLNESEFIEAEWDGKSLSRSQFQQLICHSSSSDQHFSRIVSILKIASFRLGKTLLFIDANPKERKVFLLSSDSKVCPEFDEAYSFFAYIQNAEKGIVQSHEGRSQKKIILNMLHSRISEPESILARKNGTNLVIFQKNILVTSEKTYYYQLINSAREDITVYKSSKKMIFLQQLGYHITREPQISLKNYISIASASVLSPDFLINNCQAAIERYNYPQRLKALETEGKISQVELIKSTEVEYDGILYQADESDVIDDNLGILVYYQDKLVNRLDFNFGDLFKEAFYKTKFKTATTIFPSLGIINVRKGLDLNYLGIWFKKNKGYFTFIDNIKESIRRAKISKMERQLQVGSEEAQQRRQPKPSKQ